MKPEELAEIRKRNEQRKEHGIEQYGGSIGRPCDCDETSVVADVEALLEEVERLQTEVCRSCGGTGDADMLPNCQACGGTGLQKDSWLNEIYYP